MLMLGMRSLWNRRFVVALTILSIALSAVLVIGVERLRGSAKEGFSRSASGIDLIVAARGNPVQILMATVFGVGSTGPGINWDSFEMINELPQIAWAVPIAMGDNHRGFPVVGTTREYFAHFRHSGGQFLEFASGEPFAEADGAVIGAEIAARFGYDVGATIVNAHGAGEVAFDVHDEAPFVIAGILAPTNTSVDRMVLVSLEGFDRLHQEEDVIVDPFADRDDTATGQTVAGMNDADKHREATRQDDEHGHENRFQAVAGGEHGVEDGHAHEDGDNDHNARVESVEDTETVRNNQSHSGKPHAHAHEPDKINAVYVGLADRGAVLSIQRILVEYKPEALTAVIPAVALLELWSITGTAEKVILLMASAVALSGIVAMVVMLSASLEARRREFAILRSVGATPGRIFSLIILEAALITAAGLGFGLLLLSIATAVMDPILAGLFGLHVSAGISVQRELWLALAIFIAGLAGSVIPAVRVYRMTLADGLSFKL